MIDFGKRLTQKDKRKGTFFFPSIIRQKHTSESREKKKRGLVGKKFGSCYESTTLMYM